MIIINNTPKHFFILQRIYVDEYDCKSPIHQFPRSKSFPDLRSLVYGGLEPSIPPQPRRRANSEIVPAVSRSVKIDTSVETITYTEYCFFQKEMKVARVVSETDLQRIDKKATFATHAIVQPAELLARLVNILGYIPPIPEDDDFTETEQGVQGFSDKEILASESDTWNAVSTSFFTHSRIRGSLIKYFLVRLTIIGGQ